MIPCAEQPSWLYVFGHCFLISRLKEVIHTILESADQAEEVAKTVGAPRRPRHTFKMQYVEKGSFFTFLGLCFWSL